MAIKQSPRGFTLLIAVIFMSVMLSFGLAIGSLAYKQFLLATTAIDSQYAFYAADGALECVLYCDQRLGVLDINDPAKVGTIPAVTCEGQPPRSSSLPPPANGSWIVKYTFDLDLGKRCADVSVYKYTTKQGSAPGFYYAYIFSEGYSVPCASVGASTRAVSRGESVFY